MRLEELEEEVCAFAWSNWNYHRVFSHVLTKLKVDPEL
jgi:hypothetical protein